MAMEVASVMECLGNPLKARVMIMIKEHGPLTAKQMLAYAETKVRAMVEKSYALNDELRGRIDQMVKDNDCDVYFKLFMGFAFNLLRTFEDYSKRENADIRKDGSGFFAVPVYATNKELEEAYSKILEIIAPLQKRRSEDQDLHTLAFVATPPDRASRNGD